RDRNLRRILATALLEAPLGIRVLVLSRIPPPAEFAQLRMAQRLEVLDATEVFERMPAAMRNVLLCTASLDYFDSDQATAVSGERRAPALLTSLSNRNMLVEAHAGPSVRYRYHPLFREFLLHQLRALAKRRHATTASVAQGLPANRASTRILTL